MTKEPFPPAFSDLESDTRTLETDLRSPALTVLYHPRVERIGERASLADLHDGRSRRLARSEPLFAQPESALIRPLGTKRLSRRPIVLSPALGVGIRIDPDHSRTTLEIQGRRVEGPTEIPFSRLDPGVVLLLGGQIVLLLHLLEPIAADGLPAYGQIGESSTILKLRQDIERTAELAISVLLVGEEGTGRESVARALHRASPRRDGPLIVIDCANDEILDSGSVRKAREEARGGFLYLRGIDRCTVGVQGLLRRELGAEGPEAPRLISSSRSVLQPPSFQKPFDPVLIGQVSGFVMQIPALRRRIEDFGRLFSHLLTRELEAADEPARLENGDPPWLLASLWARLARYSWPGNDRQLAELARRLVEDNQGSEVVTEFRALEDLRRHPA